MEPFPIIDKRLKLNTPEPDLTKWKSMMSLKEGVTKNVNIAILGKYFGLPDSYMSVVEALKHACLQNKVILNLHWIDADNFDIEELSSLDGVVVPGGFGYRGIEGKISAIEFIRKNNIPFLITSSLPIIIIGGFLVGIGTKIGRGCTSGHGICGIGRFSLCLLYTSPSPRD